MPKVKAPEQNSRERSRNFSEVVLGYSREQAILEASRCIACGKCVPGCPVGIDIPRFIKLVKEDNPEKAIEVIKEQNNLPAICGRVCPQESQCEKLCVLGIRDQPVAIGRLERYAAEYDKTNPAKHKSGGLRVAVVGSGPAGLTAAADVAKMGYSVTVYESLHEPGGVLRYGIPNFRLPREILDKELDSIKKLGVKIECDTVIGLTKTFEELKNEFKAIFISTGAGLPHFLDVPGETLNGVYSANEFLIRANLMKAYRFPEYDTPIKVGENVAVVGAGNVAMDSARVALRLGAKKVSIVYRRSEEEMPARKEEIEHAREEGIEIMLLTLPVELTGESGWVKAMKCVKMELGEPDASGRRSPRELNGSDFVIPADTVVVAIGQGPNPLLLQRVPGLMLDKKGRIMVDDKGMTSIKGVFAGGDIVTGAATVISAMGAGKKIAKSIDDYLKSGG